MNNKEYEKDLNHLKERILKDGDTLVSKRDLLERFCEVDEAYNSDPWNLLQILTNINILIGQEPCEKAVNEEAVKNVLSRQKFVSYEAYLRCIIEIENLSPVTSTCKKGE